MLEVNLSSFFGSSSKGLFKTVKVLEKLQNNFWKVQTSSGIISVFSEDKLETGKTVKAFIRNERNLLRLEILNQENLKASPDFFYPEALRQSDLILKTASRLNIRLSESDLYLLKKILKKNKSRKFMLPLLLEAFDRGFKTEDQLDSLTGSFQHGGRRGKRENSRENLNQYFKDKVENAENADNALFVYNRIKNRKDHSVCIPFNMEDYNIEGAVNIRILEDKILNIFVNAVKGDSDEWVFYVSPLKSGYSMKVYSRFPEKLKESESFNEFRKKLQNLRVKIDDNVKDIAFFNGYNDTNADLDVTV